MTIRADQLSAIRQQQRRPNTAYATLKKCRHEVKRAETNDGKSRAIYVLDSTAMSVEEIAVNLVKEKQLLKNELDKKFNL